MFISRKKEHLFQIMFCFDTQIIMMESVDNFYNKSVRLKISSCGLMLISVLTLINILMVLSNLRNGGSWSFDVMLVESDNLESSDIVNHNKISLNTNIY